MVLKFLLQRTAAVFVGGRVSGFSNNNFTPLSGLKVFGFGFDIFRIFEQPSPDRPLSGLSALINGTMLFWFRRKLKRAATRPNVPQPQAANIGKET